MYTFFIKIYNFIIVHDNYIYLHICVYIIYIYIWIHIRFIHTNIYINIITKLNISIIYLLY